MNIFALHDDPKLAARDLCVEHMKMLVECAQQLQTCFSLELLAQAPRTALGTVRKHGNYNQPCCKWARKSQGNMQWLIDHAYEIEQVRLRNGCQPHYTVQFIDWVVHNLEKSTVPIGPKTEHIVCINENKLCRQDVRFAAASVVEKYRLFYVYDKPFATWFNAPPVWYTELKQSISK